MSRRVDREEQKVVAGRDRDREKGVPKRRTKRESSGGHEVRPRTRGQAQAGVTYTGESPLQYALEKLASSLFGMEMTFCKLETNTATSGGYRAEGQKGKLLEIPDRQTDENDWETRLL